MATRVVSTQIVLSEDDCQRLAAFFTILIAVDRRTRRTRRSASRSTRRAKTGTQSDPQICGSFFLNVSYSTISGVLH